MHSSLRLCFGLLSAVLALSTLNTYSRLALAEPISTSTNSIDEPVPLFDTEPLVDPIPLDPIDPKPSNVPLSPDTKPSTAIEKLKSSEQHWIEIRLNSQRLIAWEGDKPVYAVIVSTGKSGTPTQIGTFAIQSKHRFARMQGPGYDVPDVPHTMYYEGSYAIHGAYWHNSFGTPVSHGCVNVALDHAKWFFDWAAIGTPVVVHD